MRSHAKAASAPSTHRENGRFSLGVIAAMLVCAAAFLGIGAPAASAAPEATPGWALQGTFDTTSYPEYERTWSAIALGAGEKIFVSAAGYRIHVFTPDEVAGGVELTRIESVEPNDIAVDEDDDTVYLDHFALLGGTTIYRYTSDGQPTPTFTLDPAFSVPQGAGMAVDQTTGNLLVADPAAEAVRRYDSAGTLLDTIATPSINPEWILAMPDGSFYVAPGSGPDLTHFSGAGAVLETISGVGAIHGLAYDPVRSLVVVSVGDKLVNFTPAGVLSGESPGHPASVGIVIASSGRLYESRGGNGGGVNFYDPGTTPGVGLPELSAITSFGVHAAVEVDPEEEGKPLPDESSVRFEYRLVGSQSWTPAGDQEVNAPGVYEADIPLQPNNSYEVRAVASNSGISKASSAVTVDIPAAPPAVATDAATDITETKAVFNGTINPFGLPTTYHFEYGTSTAYGSRIPVGIEGVAGAGRSPKPFGRTIFGLNPGTTYHFRLVATSSSGTSEGADRTFTTAAAGGVPHRAYEQVTPAVKEGANVYRRIGFQAAIDGNAFAYVTQVNEDSAPVFARSISLRDSSDWHGGIDVDPPANIGPLVRSQETLAISDDFTHALVVSNRALTPGAFEGGANLYLEDIAARSYRFVGGSDALGAFNLMAGIQTTGLFQGGSRDYSWMVFASPVSLLPDAPKDAIYRWSQAGGLEVESVLQNGEPSAGVRANYSAAYDTVSADGSRIYYTAIYGAEEGVFLREGGGPPKPISVSHVTGDPATQPATLLGINDDGRYAFLFSKAVLTSDAPEPVDPTHAPILLYRYDAADDELEYLNAQGPAEFLVRTENGSGPKIAYGSFGIGDSGDTIYFRSADSGEGISVWRDGVVHNVTSKQVIYTYEHPSPNGRYFAYYGNGSGAGGAVYLYDAATNETSCVSCLSDGTPVAATLPWQQDVSLGSRRPLAVDDTGTVYFDTPGRLVAADVNGVDDVYSYREGQATLISPGNAPYAAYISDVTPDGRNVFFTTAQKLVGRDNDEEVDVYDARVDGGLSAQNPPPPKECVRDDCKATPNAGPELPFGGSEALSGPENVKPKKHKKCGKGKRAKKVKGKVHCVKKHKASKNKKGGNR